MFCFGTLLNRCVGSVCSFDVLFWCVVWFSCVGVILFSSVASL